MKKFLLSIAFALLGISSSFAAKAQPGIFTITQSDGKQLSLRLNGDENNSWYTTADGVLLVQVGTNYYVAQVEEDGSLRATPQLAHNAEERSETELQTIAHQDKEKFYEAAEQVALEAKAIGIGTATTPYFPHKGNPKALVILVQFPDTKFVEEGPKAVFNYYLNGKAGDATPSDFGKTIINTNLGTVAQYFDNASFGQFQPQFDVVGPVTVSQSASYYGSNSGNSKDVNYLKMVKEACQLVDADVNFKDYDADGDGNVDLVYIIYAGYAESVHGNSTDCLWPKSSNGFVGTFDGINVRRHGINNELNYYPGYKFNNNPNILRLNGIGLFCHEFSHCLGLPDLYVTRVAANTDYKCMEYWDLMDEGEYTVNGNAPTPYSPWEQEVMGWKEMETLGSDAAQITMKPYNEEATAYKINSPSDNQYVILQNIQNQGLYRGMLGHGLLVYRIDYPNSTVNMGDNPNNNANTAPAVTIIPADGELISSYLTKTDDDMARYIYSHYGDPYPGQKTTDGRNFEPLNVTSIQEFALNRGVVIDAPIYNIKETNGVITFDYLKDFTTGIDSPITNVEADKDASIYTLDGRYLGTDASKLGKGVYVIGKKKVVIK